MMRSRLLPLALIAALALPAAANAAATITIVNLNAPGVGFNDPTPVAPLPTNPGTTLGQQRLNAFQYAANVWGAVLDSAVPIYIQARFTPLTCTATSAVLGSAGAIQIFANFPGRDLDNTWYHVALANRLAGADLAPGANGTSADDIVANFNSNLGQPTCLASSGWYYGLDANQPANRINLVTVLLHEFGHGLGFSTFTRPWSNATTPNPAPRILGLGDVYAFYIHDSTANQNWNSMTIPQLQASAINSRRVTWDGITVNAEAPGILALGTPLLTVNSPAAIAGGYAIGAASFGPALAAPGVTGNLVQALDPADGAGPTTFDGCSAITNAAAIAGNVALVDRGTCGFTLKVKNCQNAGAIAVVVADNVAGGPPAGLGGADPTIVIPSARVTLGDGNTLKANLGGGVNVTLGVDMTVRAGVEAATGFVHLNAPSPYQPGSSISHWDPITFPNQLMEPAINADLTHNLSGVDLTRAEMTDIGWFSDFDGVPDGRDVCLGSDQSDTVIIDGCDSGAENDVFADGCRVSDSVKACAQGAGNHGAFVSCVTQAMNGLRNSGAITHQEKGAIQACAAGASTP